MPIPNPSTNGNGSSNGTSDTPRSGLGEVIDMDTGRVETMPRREYLAPPGSIVMPRSVIYLTIGAVAGFAFGVWFCGRRN